MATEDFHNVADLSAAILCKGVSLQIKRGLGREYIEKTESLSALRGRIDLSESIKTRSVLRQRLVCSFDDFSVNTPMNQILKATMILDDDFTLVWRYFQASEEGTAKTAGLFRRSGYGRYTQH